MTSYKLPKVSVINHQRVLLLIRVNGPLSRADMARQTQLTKATISKIVSDLEDAGLVQQVGFTQEGRGRPSMLYEFNNRSSISIGVEILLDEIQAVVTQMDAKPLMRYSKSLSGLKPDMVTKVIQEITEDVKSEFQDPILGMGVGVPGICDDQQRVVRFSERLNWRDVPFADMLENIIDLPVSVENRANAAALGERWFGAGQDSEDFIYVNIGSGIKAGIIMKGELFMGHGGCSGEIGHMTIVPDGPLCVCGKRGCLEALASTIAIRERVLSLIQAEKAQSLISLFRGKDLDLSMRQIIDAANVDDPAVNAVLLEAARYIGLAISGIVNILNPEMIILGPLVKQVPIGFLDEIREVVQRHSFDINCKNFKIVPTKLGTQAVAIGSAALLLEQNLRKMQNSANFPDDFLAN
jgi:glucokinase-like ROK family protein